MNTNHVCPTCSVRSNLPIRLAPFAVDERAVFVHSVCASLIDSRFGPGRSTPMVVNLSESPEIEPAAFCDLTIEGPLPSYSILPDSEVARRCMADAILSELERYTLMAGVSIHGQNSSPSTLGRGSPQRSLGRIGSPGPRSL